MTQTVKYGVMSLDALKSDLSDWHSLYVAGRLHKPVRIVVGGAPNDDVELYALLRTNLDNALACALLLQAPVDGGLVCFDEIQLYRTIASLSYRGLPCAIIYLFVNKCAC